MTILKVQSGSLQGDELTNDNVVKTLKQEETKRREEKLKAVADTIEQNVSPDVRRAISDAKESGASNWLTAVPLYEHDFVLNKSEFRDAINIRYAKELKGLPSKCPCGQTFDMTHALNCKTGGFVTNYQTQPSEGL